MRHPENGEEKILRLIFDGFGIEHGYYVDIGSGGQYSNTEWLNRPAAHGGMEQRDMGWTGLRIDQQDHPAMHVTVENVGTILTGVPDEFQFLSLDIDGMDYWILKAILRTRRPLVICVEYNQAKMAEDDIQPYDSRYLWKGEPSFGCSWRALNALIEPLGYLLVFKNLVNVIFVRNTEDFTNAVLPRD